MYIIPDIPTPKVELLPNIHYLSYIPLKNVYLIFQVLRLATSKIRPHVLSYNLYFRKSILVLYQLLRLSTE